MKKEDCLEKLLFSFEKYYDISKKSDPPFCAEAIFHSRSEEFFLIRSAKLSQTESNEYVFFALLDYLTVDSLHSLSTSAWERGLSLVQPKAGHRNSDISLIVIADSTEEKVFRLSRSIRFYKSYLFSFFGWSSFSLGLLDSSSGQAACNRRGENLEKLLLNAWKQKSC